MKRSKIEEIRQREYKKRTGSIPAYLELKKVYKTIHQAGHILGWNNALELVWPLIAPRFQNSEVRKKLIKELEIR